MNLEPSDSVLIQREAGGLLKLVPITEHKQQKVRDYTIDADLCSLPNLLTRLIIASYVLGHDRIRVIAKDELKSTHLEEIRATIRRLNGLSIVEQNPKQMTLQISVDSTRFPVHALMRRLHFMISAMLETSMRALVKGRFEPVAAVSQMEEESDSLYWLIVRQLLLAMHSQSAATKIGIESPLHIAGNRVVAKILEEMADSARNIADEVLTLKDRKITNKIILNDIAKFSNQVMEASEHNIEALLVSNIKLASDAAGILHNVEGNERMLTRKILRYVKDASVSVSLRTIVWNLFRIAEYCRIIGEVAINRILEKPSQITYASHA